jgi:hypothetical protein
MKRLMIILVGMVCMLSIIGFGIPTRSVEAAGSIYYVAKNGSDNNNGSVNSPWLTINHAAQEVTAGNTVNIETGTYNERIIPANSGSAGSPITYQNYNGESVIIDGTGLSLGQSGLFDINSGITGHAMNYITISGLTIQNAGSSSAYTAGVFVSGSCDHITIENLTVDRTGVSGIYVQSGWQPTTTRTATNIFINNCIVYDTNEAQSQEAISLINVNGFQVENCTVYGVEYPGGAGIDMKVGCENGSINNCNVYACPDVPLIYVDARMATSNINIYDNIIHDGGTDSQGIVLADELGENSMTNINIYNNLIYNNYRGFTVQDYSPENNTYNFKFENNTLYNNSASSGAEIFIMPTHTQLSSCVIRNNMFFSLTRGSYGILYGNYASGGITVDHNLFYNSTGSWNSSNVFGASDITTNPLVVSPTNNFALQSGSPAIGVGSATGAPATDFAGTARANPPCIGAYEYETASTSSNNSAGTVATTAGSFGYDGGTTAYSPSTGYIHFCAPGYSGVNATATSMSAMVSNTDTTAHNVQLAIYTLSGSTYTLVSSTGTIAIPAGAAGVWITGNFTTAPSLSSATTYYLGIETDNANVKFWYSASTSNEIYGQSATFGSWPVSFSGQYADFLGQIGVLVNY